MVLADQNSVNIAHRVLLSPDHGPVGHGNHAILTDPATWLACNLRCSHLAW